jgi:hypothetical protein
MSVTGTIFFSILLLLQEVSSFHHILPAVSAGALTNSPARRVNPIPFDDIYHRRTAVSPIYSSETSFSSTNLGSSQQESLQVRFQRLLVAFPSLGVLCNQVVSWKAAAMNSLRETWWLSPMLLALIPIYSAVFLRRCACMPEWWQVVKMDTIRQSKDAALIIGGFLVSNIAYFASGVFLLARFPIRSVKKRDALLPLLKPTPFSMLGIWILLAGTVSTIFHSTQALGSHAMSESLCYVDHAVAISAAFYFLKQCGFPSRKVWAIGIASLITLVFYHPSYATIHSLWHFLSATTATQWALEGYQRALARKSLHGKIVKS